MSLIRIALNAGSIALVAVLGWLVVRIGVGVTQAESLYEPDPIIAPSRTASAAVNSVSYDFSSDPFAFGEVVIEEAEILEDAPETTLNLKLIGIVSESNATFRLSDGTNKAVKIGDEIMNDVTLTRTAKDFVSLNVNGEAQKLTLERVKLGEKNTASQIVRAAPQSSSSGNAPSGADIEKLFSQVQLTPHRELQPDKSSRVLGFKIQARSGANLSQLGLKSGDVLTRVGPVKLDGKGANIKELRGLVSSGAAQDFEVIRNGSPVTIRIGQ